MLKKKNKKNVHETVEIKVNDCSIKKLLFFPYKNINVSQDEHF